MTKNCRNCKWANVERHPSGRRNFNAWTECTYPVNIQLPICRHDLAHRLSGKVSAYIWRTDDIKCATWELQK